MAKGPWCGPVEYESVGGVRPAPPGAVFAPGARTTPGARGQEPGRSAAGHAGADGGATKSVATQTASAFTGLVIVTYCRATTATNNSNIRMRVRMDTLDAGIFLPFGKTTDCTAPDALLWSTQSIRNVDAAAKMAR